MRFKSWIILISMIVSLSLAGQVMSVDSVLNAVIRNNPELRMYDARIESAREYASGAN
jgi:hypothetical protein